MRTCSPRVWFARKWISLLIFADTNQPSADGRSKQLIASQAKSEATQASRCCSLVTQPTQSRPSSMRKLCLAAFQAQPCLPRTDPAYVLSPVHELSVAYNNVQHTSFAGTSQCTFQAVRAYFQNGTLPAPGIVCPIEETMFGNTTAVPSSKDDLALTSAVRQLVRNTKVKMFGSLL
jgi:hypothetical protein